MDVNRKLSEEERLNVYKGALQLSNSEFLSQSDFEDKLHAKYKWSSNGLFQVGFPWVIEMMDEFCPNIYVRNITEGANFLYLFVAIFTCIKKLLISYINKYGISNNMVQPTLAAGFLVAWESLELHKVDACKNWQTDRMLYEMEYYCVDCVSGQIKGIMDEMMYMSGYRGCIDEYKAMILYLQGV